MRAGSIGSSAADVGKPAKAKAKRGAMKREPDEDDEAILEAVCSSFFVGYRSMFMQHMWVE
jgi:hypothetical protein